jgi:hypothetical protein
MKAITIDYFELTVLIEASWHTGTILRYGILEKAIVTWYNQLEDNDRARLYDFFKRNYKVENEIQEIFMARYDPDNQYIITTLFEGKEATFNTFLHNKQYKIGKDTSIHEKYITKVIKRI